jgi:hypothetical protein
LGAFEIINTENTYSYIYSSAGDYEIRCTGKVNYFDSNGYNPLLIKEVKKCGALFLMQQSFLDAENLIWTATDFPQFGSDNLSYFFSGCLLVNNASIGFWPMTGVKNGSYFFQNASSFNQPLYWDFSTFEDLTDFLTGSAFSTTNYDLLLNHLAAHPTLQMNVPLGVGSTQYTAASAVARAYIIATYNWSITDGGLI